LLFCKVGEVLGEVFIGQLGDTWVVFLSFSSSLWLRWDWVHLVRRPLIALLYELPYDRWILGNWWNKDWHGKPKYSEKAYPSDTLSTIFPTWHDLRSNPGRRGGKPATNRLSYGTAWHLSEAGLESSSSHFSASALTDLEVLCRQWLWPLYLHSSNSECVVYKMMPCVSQL
jgi:hypothetical protein